MLKGGYNVILLDEPTTTSTRKRWPRWKTRWRICRLRRHHLARPHVPRPSRHPILAFEGDSHVEWFEVTGDYEQDKIRRLGADAVNPKRVTYKRLTR